MKRKTDKLKQSSIAKLTISKKLLWNSRNQPFCPNCKVKSLVRAELDKEPVLVCSSYTNFLIRNAEHQRYNIPIPSDDYCRDIYSIDKGQIGGVCNRTDCNNYNAVFYNTSTSKFYCRTCAYGIQKANWDANPPVFQAQFWSSTGSKDIRKQEAFGYPAILDIRVRWDLAYGNSPSLYILVDDIKPMYNMKWKKKQGTIDNYTGYAYWGSVGPFYRFWSWSGEGNDGGIGGAKEIVTMEDGSEETLLGPWSGNSKWFLDMTSISLNEVSITDNILLWEGNDLHSFWQHASVEEMYLKEALSRIRPEILLVRSDLGFLNPSLISHTPETSKKFIKDSVIPKTTTYKGRSQKIIEVMRLVEVMRSANLEIEGYGYGQQIGATGKPRWDSI